jgi:SAM-dependent methyltransferase
VHEDPETYRARSRERWERAAVGWGTHRDWWDRATRPVSERMVEALEPQPGQRVLELAAGPGDVGLLIAELVRPGGSVLLTDGADPMVDVARSRVADRRLGDVVEVKPMEAEWIDLPAASVDAVACRWGYMLLADPDAALRETRRVLRPGGRLALAAWAGPDENPWSSAVGRTIAEAGLAEPPAPGDPGQFAWADAAAIGERLRDAGFMDVEVETVEFELTYPDLDAWWDLQIDFSMTLYDALAATDPATRDAVMEAAQGRLREFVRDDGSVAVPAATHVARAEA